jgi:hypothetical protein
MSRRGPGFFSLNFRRDPDKILIASTGWPQNPPEWETLPEGQVLEIRRDSLSAVLYAL